MRRALLALGAALALAAPGAARRAPDQQGAGRRGRRLVRERAAARARPLPRHDPARASGCSTACGSSRASGCACARSSTSKAGEVDTDTAAGFSIGLQTPLREVITDTDEDIAGNTTVGVGGGRARRDLPAGASRPPAPRDGIGRLPRPGRLVPVAVPASRVQRKPAKVEFPVEFELEVIGDPQPDASPEPTPAKATPAPEPEGGTGRRGLGRRDRRDRARRAARGPGRRRARRAPPLTWTRTWSAPIAAQFPSGRGCRSSRAPAATTTGRSGSARLSVRLPRPRLRAQVPEQRWLPESRRCSLETRAGRARGPGRGLSVRVVGLRWLEGAPASAGRARPGGAGRLARGVLRRSARGWAGARPAQLTARTVRSRRGAGARRPATRAADGAARLGARGRQRRPVGTASRGGQPLLRDGRGRARFGTSGVGDPAATCDRVLRPGPSVPRAGADEGTGPAAPAGRVKPDHRP